MRYAFTQWFLNHLGSFDLFRALGTVTESLVIHLAVLFEASSFIIFPINIGDRQGGRLRSESVIDC